MAMEPSHALKLSHESSAILADVEGWQREKIMSRLFYRLSACFGAQFDNRLIGDDVKAAVVIAEWTHRLNDMPVEWIERGLERLDERPARDRKFAPGAVEFADLCRPTAADLGIPEKWDAYALAQKRQYPHPMIAVLTHSIRHERLVGHNPEGVRREWSRAYDEALDEARRGKTFEYPPGMDPQRKAPRERRVPLRTARPETVQAHLDTIRQSGAVGVE